MSRIAVGILLLVTAAAIVAAAVWRNAGQSRLAATVESHAPEKSADDRGDKALPAAALPTEPAAAGPTDPREFFKTIDWLDLSERSRKARRTDFPLSAREMDAILEASDILIDEQQRRPDRMAAAQMLGSFGHAFGRPALLTVLLKNEDSVLINRSCVVSLSFIADKRSVEPLIDLLADDDVGILASDKLLKLLPAGKEWDSGSFGTEDPAARREIQAQWRTWWSQNRERAAIDFEGVFESD